MKYLLIHHIDESVRSGDADGPGADDLDEDREREAWDAEMTARGILVGGGEVMISDGPFAETKEQIAGYSVLECAGLDEAIEVSARHPDRRVRHL